MSKTKKQRLPEKKSNHTLVYAGASVLVIAAFVLYFYAAPQETPVEKVPTTGEYVKLNLTSTYEPGKIKIIEFMKFDCSHCYEFHKNLPDIVKKYGNNVTITYVPIVWKGQSTKSIEAYIIAEQMGKGVEMQDALFDTEWVKKMDVMESVQTLENVASSIGLGSDFNSKLEGNYARDAALANLGNMSKYSVEGTPTIIINGNLQVKIPTATNLDMAISSLLS